jgi:hypothetical protein
LICRKIMGDVRLIGLISLAKYPLGYGRERGNRPIALIASALPCAWIGVWLYTRGS